MSVYSPVLTGDTQPFRSEIEGFLTTDDALMSEQIERQHEACVALGHTATFGMEMEFMLAENPLAPDVDTPTDDEIYAEIVREVDILSGGTDSTRYDHRKGDVVTPANHPDPIMVTKNYSGQLSANMDQYDSGIIEIRTAPATPTEAIERYWRMVQAVGVVAERNSLLALPLAIHMNAAVWSEDDNEFLPLHGDSGGKLVAAVQHNLIALNPLQLDAGVEENVTAIETFGDTKDSSMAAHNERLEIRHPVVGAIDPRVDVLAVLGSTRQWAENDISQTALDKLHQCREISWFDSTRSRSIGRFIEYQTLWDEKLGRLVLPALKTKGSGDGYVDYDEAANELLGTPDNDGLAHNAMMLRTLLSDLRYDGLKASLSPDSQFNNTVAKSVQNVEITTYLESTWRVLPHYVDDSPESHRARRQNILRSSTVRKLLGRAASSLRPAREAIEARRELIDKNMVVVADEVSDEE